MNAYCEAKCPKGHDFLWLVGTPFVCWVCGYPMYIDNCRDPNELTIRELEILALLAIGFANCHLANALSITDSTVESHLVKIFQKLGVTSRVQAARWAWDRKITWEYVQKLKKEKV